MSMLRSKALRLYAVRIACRKRFRGGSRRWPARDGRSRWRPEFREGDPGGRPRSGLELEPSNTVDSEAEDDRVQKSVALRRGNQRGVRSQG